MGSQIPASLWNQVVTTWITSGLKMNSKRRLCCQWAHADSFLQYEAECALIGR